MSSEIDKLVLDRMRKEIRDDETYKLAVSLYRKFKEGGARAVKQYIYEILKERGVDLSEVNEV